MTTNNSATVQIPIINKSRYPFPQYATPYAAGMDVYANLTEPITLAPLQRQLVPTGLFIALPAGYEAQLRPRSGWALKHGITLLNSPGTIDADYRGEIGVILANLSDTPFTINPGDRVCQMVVTQYTSVEWQPTTTLEETERGEGGFGHSGHR